MKSALWPCAAFLLFSLALGGCSDARRDDAGAAGPDSRVAAKAPDPEEEQKIQANLAKLNPEDRKLAEEQRFCVVEEENRLGSMGVPAKVMVKGQPVFLCCKGCKKNALADPDRTLARLAALEARVAGATAP